jgi:hypothetical protein
MSSAIHDELVERVRYFDGHSDTLGLAFASELRG